MAEDKDTLTVDDLNLALRLWRRLMLRIFAIAFFGLIGAFFVDTLSYEIDPPYGLHFAGMRLEDWWWTGVVVILIMETYWDGRKIGRIMGDPVMMTFPAMGMLSVITTISQKAAAMGMTSSRFLGPLQPIAKKN
jgi:hypothetical protein